MNIRTKVKSVGTELQTPASPPEAATSRPGHTTDHRFKVHADLGLHAAAEVVVNAGAPEEAGRLVERILQGRPFAEQLHKMLEQHELRVTSQSGQQVVVRVELVLLDLPPEATVWNMTGL